MISNIVNSIAIILLGTGLILSASEIINLKDRVEKLEQNHEQIQLEQQPPECKR